MNVRDRHDGGQPNHPGYDRTPSKQEVRETIRRREKEEARQDRDRVDEGNESYADDDDGQGWRDGI